MNKLKVRCKKIFINTPEFSNVLVYIVLNGGWSSFKLFVCVRCKEIFVGNLENPLLRISVQDIGQRLSCPNCKVSFRENLREYPETIILPNNQEYRYLVPRPLNTEDSDIYEFYELG